MRQGHQDRATPWRGHQDRATTAGPPGQGHAMQQGHPGGGTLKPQVCRHSRLRVETAGETESPGGTRLPLSPRGTPRHPVFLGWWRKEPRRPRIGSSLRESQATLHPGADRGTKGGCGASGLLCTFLPQSPSTHRDPDSLAWPATPSGRRCRLRSLRGPAPATVTRPGDTDVTSRRDGGCGARRRPGLPPRFIRPEPN